MGKTLVIAEKPSVARDYARVLGCGSKGEGYLYNQRYIVSWAIGHLITLAEPDAYSAEYKHWRMSDLPIIPSAMKLTVIPQSSKQYKILKTLMLSDEVDSLICGTDSGREGELIFRYIYQMTGCHKPFQRLWVSSMTDEAIRSGFHALKDGRDYDQLYLSAKCRSEADWLVGINGSRAYTLRYHTLLSVGRVQTPTLAMIVKRKEEIDAFIPENYWEVIITLESEPSFTARWFRMTEKDGTQNFETKIRSREESEQIKKRCGKGKMAVVSKITSQIKKQQPPLLYDLTALQRDGNQKFGFSAARVLDLAQSLYEKHKLITYPRTDSRYLSDDMKETVRKALYAVNIREFHQDLMGIPELKFTSRIFDNSKVTDHTALIPTSKKPDLTKLTEDEQKIYCLIVRRLIAAFYPPYEYESTQVILSVEEDSFLARGQRVIHKGYRSVAGYDSEKDKEASEPLPELHEQDTLMIAASKVKASKTSPPSPYTEASLLKAMESVGRHLEDETLKNQMKSLSLGTPATRASIIERLIKVGYITRKGKTLLPTEKGVSLIAVMPVEMKQPETTARWERALERIYQGSMQPEAFMRSIDRYVVYLVQEAQKPGHEDVVFPKEPQKRWSTRGKSGKSSARS